jgi:hypothetical protein
MNMSRDWNKCAPGGGYLDEPEVGSWLGGLTGKARRCVFTCENRHLALMFSPCYTRGVRYASDGDA